MFRVCRVSGAWFKNNNDPVSVPKGLARKKTPGEPGLCEAYFGVPVISMAFSVCMGRSPKASAVILILNHAWAGCLAS